MNEFMKNLLVWMILAAVTLVLFNQFQGSPEEARVGNPHRIDYTQFINEVKSDRVARVDMDGRTIHGFYASGDHFMTFNPGDPGLVGDLLNHNVVITAPPPEKQGVLMQMFISWFPMLLLIAVWIFFMRSAGGLGGKNGPLSFGKSKARMQSEDQVKVTFEDVAGADEAKEEVHEIVDFLRDPEKYRKLGGKIPRGVLMVGPPGTGKTLLAKAIAGEAKVPFFTISGSDFVEMFVGVGASRVRDMFEQAKAHAPCIIFIDEIDAVGRSRGAGMGGGNDEREQTLNQMLVEMDGFEGNEGIIVIAATNRPDVLDPALLRPGRFDRQVTIGLPDVRGREQILKVHMRKVPMEEGVKPGAIARGTPGFSGADLANLVNEAALFAARMGKEKVNHEDFEKAKDKIIMGVERKSMVMKDDEKRLTAYHEAGHAIIGHLVPEHDPVYKVSIIPRGRALGVTMYLPEEDRYSYSKRRLESQLSSLYGGRIAEEMVFGADAVTTGASNDIERATSLARSMVMKWGMSDKLGPQMYEEEDNSNPFLGGGMSRTKALSPETGKLIDDEIHRFIETNYQRAERILKENSDKLHIMADALMLYETIDDVQIAQIMNEGRFPDAPEGWNDEIATDATGGGEPPAQAQSADASADAVLDAGASADATNPPDAQPKWR
jgi:cell division protease FtsH